MTKPSPLALEQLFTPTEIGPEVRPTDKARKFFEGLRPHLKHMPWNSMQSMLWHNSFNGTFHPNNDSPFQNSIFWVLDEDPDGLTNTDISTQGEYWKERVAVCSPDYSRQATLEFARNVLSASIVNLLNNTRTATMPSDLSYIKVFVAATAPNKTDQLVATYEASASFPEGKFRGITRSINCAPELTCDFKTDDEVSSRKETVRHEYGIKPTDDELAVLQQAAQCFTSAIEFIRSH